MLRQLEGLPHVLLAAHLLVLTFLSGGGWQTVSGRLFWPVAVGLFLLWQPFFGRGVRIGGRQGGALLALVAATAAWLNPWLLLIWSGALAAIIGGRVAWTGRVGDRFAYLFAFAYLLALILLGLLPDIAPGVVAPDPLPRDVILRALPFGLILLLLLPRGKVPRRPAETFDFVSSLMVFLLLALFIMGSLTYMLLGRVGYTEAVFRTSLVIAGALLLFAWAWDPRAGFSGIGAAFSRHLLSFGMPLEQWLVILGEESERVREHERFLDALLVRLAKLPWATGGEWRTGSREGRVGESSAYEHAIERAELRLVLYFRHVPSPAMRWHVGWLMRLAAEFYLVKRHALALEQASYLQAVYRTGARVTHDVKNLLQSLQALCFAAARHEEPEAAARLMASQLPQIAERLRVTLDKLQRPAGGPEAPAEADVWWKALRQRYAHAGIEWEDTGLPSPARLPAGVYDSVAENLLQNALSKRQREPGIIIRVAFDAAEAILRVSDSGTPIADARARRLFAEPVDSEDGLGIGLYHAARMAEEQGCVLGLEENLPGRVVFRLAGR